MRSSVSDSLGGCRAKCVLQQGLARQHFHGYALDARSGAGEVALDERFLQADGLEDLRALITLQRGNAHLRKGLQEAFVDRLHIVLENFVPGVVERESAAAMQVLERFDGQIRIHGAGAVAQQQGEVHHLARLARFHDQRHLIARLLANQMIVNGGKRQQAGYRRMLVVHAAVGENQQRVAGLDGQRGRRQSVLDGFFELLFAALHAEDHGQGGGQKIAPAHAAQFLQAPVGDDRDGAA